MDEYNVDRRSCQISTTIATVGNNKLTSYIAMVDLDNIIPDMPMTMESSIFLSENDPQEETSSIDNSSEATDATTINNSALAENSDSKLIKSSKGWDKLSYSGYIFNFQRESTGAHL